MYQQKGLSLIELMISITLGLILMTGVAQMFLSSKRTFGTQQGLSRVQETGRLAIDFIAQDIRMAGFTGFNSRGTTVTNKIASPTIVNNYAEGISVFATTPVGVSSLPNTDVLVVRGALQSNNVPVSAGSALNLIKVPTGTNVVGGCKNLSIRFNSLCNDEALVIADYSKAYIFAPTAIVTNGTDLDISFAGVWGKDEFVAGAQVSTMKTVIYYIDNGTAGFPSLYQQINNETPLELLEGVKDMYITFSRAKTPTVFATAAGTIGPLWATFSANPTLKAKNPIVGVRIQLLVQSTENNVLESPQIYNFRGANVTATDRRMYQVFTTTVALRDQLP